MRSLAVDEHSDLLDKLSSLAEKTFPSLLVPPSKTAHLSSMMELKAGVGGSEAALFLGEVMRMYTNLAQTMGWQITIVAKNLTDNGGVKDAILEIKGEKVYDTLRWETGVHRVQRVPLTESSGRVHTSTVAVLVMPLSEESDVDEDLFKMEDVKIEVMRSKGAGGQVRVLPSDTTVYLMLPSSMSTKPNLPFDSRTSPLVLLSLCKMSVVNIQ